MTSHRSFSIPALAWLSLQFLLPAGLAAQEAGKKIRLAACATDIVADLQTLHLASGGNHAAKTATWLDIPLNVFTLSQPIEYEGPRTLNFLAAATADAKPVASIELPGDARSYMLVFVPNVESSGYRVIPIVEADFPYGSYFLVNCSMFPVAVNIANQKKVLPPGGRANFAGANGQPQDVRIHASIHEQARLVRSTSWQLNANQREVVLFYNQPGSDQVRSKHFMAIRAAETSPKNPSP